MIWFLKLFGEYRKLLDEVRHLREGYSALTAQNLALQDRMDAVLEDRTRIWSILEQSMSGERTAYQAHINMAWQKQMAGIPYPDAPHMAEESAPRPQSDDPIPRRRLPSEVVADRTNRFLERKFGT